LAGTLAHILGWGVLVSGTAAVALAIGRRAASLGILVPLLVGVGLRFAVMLIAHIGSLSLHDHGLLFVDDGTHFSGAKTLARLWGDGQVPNPVSHDVLGTFQFGYPAFVAVLFTLGTPSIILGKLANVLLGGVTVLLTARIAGRVLGERAQLRAAWVAALAPTLIWWSAPLLKEALATTLVAAALLAVTYLPRPRAVAALGVALALLLVIRSAAVLALVLAAGAAVLIAGRQVERRWVSRPVVVMAASVALGLLAVVFVVSGGDVQSFYHQYDLVIHRMIRVYQGSSPAHVPYDAVKSLVTPLPWAFGNDTNTWDRGLYPGTWVLLCALPLALAGFWRLRRRPEGWLLAVTVVTSVVANAFTSGFVFRQRSMVEPLILVLALAGARSWRMAARAAAAALALAAVVAGVNTHSIATAAYVAAGAALLLLLSRWLPARRFEPLPDSPMVSSFRGSLAAGARGAGGARPLRRLGVTLADARTRLARFAPSRIPRAEQGSLPGRGRLGHRAAVGAALVAFAVVSLLLIPRIHADGVVGISTYELGTDHPAPGVRVKGAARADADGYRVGNYSSGRVTFTVRAPAGHDSRTRLIVWGGGGSAVSSTLTLVDAAGRRHVLGSPASWQAHPVDVTAFGQGPLRLEFAADNTGTGAQLFADQVRVATYRSGAVPEAGRWEAAAWVALGALLALVVFRRPVRDFVLVAAAPLATYIAWPHVITGMLQPSGGDLADPVAHAKWLDLDHGLLSGTFDANSALAVQLFHVLSPITGTGTAGVRTASLLVGVLALVVVYALGARLAGFAGGLAALAFALLSDPFRASLGSGDSTSTLILSSCLFLLAAHRSLVRGDRTAMIGLGVTGALMILALPICWPGVLAAVGVLVLRSAAGVRTRTALAVAFVTLGLVLLPSRIGLAHQSGGAADADVVQLASGANTIELGPLPDGSPREIGLVDYLTSHTPRELAGGTLHGASDGLSAASERGETKLVGLLALVAGVAGTAILLVLPGLRLLVIAPALVALVPWFFEERGALPPFPAEAMFWPVLPLGAAALAYTVVQLSRGRLARPRRLRARSVPPAQTGLAPSPIRVGASAET
jgi:hypothetical protein